MWGFSNFLGLFYLNNCTGSSLNQFYVHVLDWWPSRYHGNWSKMRFPWLPSRRTDVLGGGDKSPQVFKSSWLTRFCDGRCQSLHSNATKVRYEPHHSKTGVYVFVVVIPNEGIASTSQVQLPWGGNWMQNPPRKDMKLIPNLWAIMTD